MTNFNAPMDNVFRKHMNVTEKLFGVMIAMIEVMNIEGVALIDLAFSSTEKLVDGTEVETMESVTLDCTAQEEAQEDVIGTSS